jgi:transcriptional regulator with XRE-family HTH domain
MSFFGTNIKKIRQVKGLSQKAFADLFNLNRGVISAYEEGRAEPKIDTLLKVAHHFNLDINDFLTKTLQVNNLVSGSVIDTLMFSPVEPVGNTIESNISNENPVIIDLLQKILARVDRIYECKAGVSILSGYHIGDYLFLVQSKSPNDREETLVILDQGNLKYLSEITEKDLNSKEIYTIAGYFSSEQKNIISDILKRIDILERNASG